MSENTAIIFSKKLKTKKEFKEIGFRLKNEYLFIGNDLNNSIDNSSEETIEKMKLKKNRLLKFKKGAKILCLVFNKEIVKNRSIHVCYSDKCRNYYHNYTNDERDLIMIKFNH